MESKISKIHNVKLFVYDFDGVMTDNTFSLDKHGNESVSLNRSDGLAISLLKKKGFQQIILSSENSKVIKHRSKKLGIESYIGIKNKLSFLSVYLNKKNLCFSQIAYIGNDINDYEAMNMAGVKICPNDAQKSIKEICDIILDMRGGKGVIREILFLLTGS